MTLKAGWYPQDDGQDRYWDGVRWTDAYRLPVTSDEAVEVTHPQAEENVTPVQAEESEKKPVPIGCLALILAPVLLIVAFSLKSCAGGTSSSSDGYQVQYTCEELVKKNLRNPTTADFSEQQRSSASAYGLVTAENALGGKVTYRYACSVSGDTVRLDSLNER